MKDKTQNSLQTLQELIETVHRLRAPGGCPWDQAQTHQSLRPFLIEESYEVLDVLDQIEKDEDVKKPQIQEALKEELGDLLLQVLLHSEMVSEKKVFNIFDVADTLNEKLIRRHPHVFGESDAVDAESALQNWEKQKAKEKAQDPQASILDGLPKNLPALQKGTRTIEKVSKVGFQWDNLKEPFDKVLEEVQELQAEVQAFAKEKNEAEKERLRTRASEELGDVFFSLCNLSYLLQLNPEDSLRSTLSRFERRFRHVEKRLKEKNKNPSDSTLEEMDHYWNEAKKIEREK